MLSASNFTISVRLAAKICQDPLGELTALLDPLTGLKGKDEKERGWQGKERKDIGKEEGEGNVKEFATLSLGGGAADAPLSISHSLPFCSI